MAAPTFVQEAETVWNSGTEPKTTASFDIEAGDVLVAYGACESYNSATEASSLSVSGGGLTWTLQASIAITDYCWVGIWTARAVLGTSITVDFTRNADTSAYWFGGNVLTFRNSDGPGAVISYSDVGPARPVNWITTTRPDSAIVVACADWSAVDGASRVWRAAAGAATEQTYFRDAAHYGVYAARHMGASAVANYEVGLNDPDGQKVSLVALEIRGTRDLTVDTGVYSQSGNDVGLATSPGPSGKILIETGDRLLMEDASFYLLEGAGAVGYTLDVTTGTYTYTGVAVGLAAARTLPVSVGTYAQTGNAVGVLYGRAIGVSTGVYALTGNAVGLLAARQLPVSAGSYAQTGIDVGVLYGRQLPVSVGTYAYAGTDVLFARGFTIPVSAGSYGQTGNDVGLLAYRQLPVSVGTYTYTGNGVGLIHGYVLGVTPGAYNQTGNDVLLVATRRLDCATGVYAVTGNDAGLLVARQLPVSAGSYTQTGNDVGLAAARTLPVSVGTYLLTGNDAGVLYGRAIGVTAGTYAQAGNDVGLLADRLLGVLPGAYVYAGNDVQIIPPGGFIATWYRRRKPPRWPRIILPVRR